MGGIRKGVVVAAGLGTRLRTVSGKAEEFLKPLYPVGGKPLMEHVLSRAEAAGLEEVVIVTGYRAFELNAFAKARQGNLKLTLAHNPDFHLSNGISLLVGGLAAGEDFVLMMSDHIFQKETLAELLVRGLKEAEMAVLAIDRKISSVFDLDDATKVVVRDDDSILEIGKNLNKYNAIDTGMFLISQELVQVLEGLVKEQGDASISAAMAVAIEQGGMGGFNIGDRIWQDVDTPEMFVEAERLLAAKAF